MRLAETIAGWFGRVEVVVAGVDGYLHEGEEALAKGDPMRARAAAKAVLLRVLDRHPDAKRAVVAALEAVAAEDVAGRA